MRRDTTCGAGSVRADGRAGNSRETGKWRHRARACVKRGGRRPTEPSPLITRARYEHTENGKQWKREVLWFFRQITVMTLYVL